MSQRILPPVIDPRKASDLFRSLREMVSHYTPEWPAKDDDDPGVALLKIFSFIGEGVISRLNRAPDRNFLAFLDMLGIRLLQARPAQVPVRFLVANGIEVPFVVDSRSQVSAPPTGDRQEDLPFETLTPLLVIPSTLASLIAVDPAADAIYKPPPGFLALETAATPLPELRVMAFSGVGAKNLQLDPPEQVKKDDFLRVDRTVAQRTGPDQCVPIVCEKESSLSEHLVVDDVKGAVVTLLDPLKADYVEGTTVQKVTQFELFQAKNWQEHILYLAHADYFSIKSEAEITIRVQHAGANSNLQSLKIVWEFFGSVEALKDDPDTWHEFQIEADGTQGLSRDGQIVLTKPAGEIKETEIDGTKSRWIRARLDQSLTASPSIPVPRIELIDFAVSSGGKELSPDNAFNNDTPLTTDVPFFPFGTEPRIFDRFSIASKEAFSKPGAEVTLDLQLDFADLLASPVAIFQGKKIRVFAYGAAGRLVEFQLDPVASGFDPIPHRAPLDQRLVGGTVPSVVANPAGTAVGVFAKIDDGKIHLRHIPDGKLANSEWFDLENRKLPGELSFDPAAVLFNGKWRVYVVADNRVHFREVDPAAPSTPADWIEVTSTNTADKPAAASTPSAVVVPTATGGNVWLAVVDNNKRTWFYDGQDWHDTGSAESFLAAPNARPLAITIPETNPTHVRIFVKGAQGGVVGFLIDTSTSAFAGEDLDQPDPSVTVDSNVFAFTKEDDAQIFVKGSDNQLWERLLTTKTWTMHHNSLDAQLAGDPFAITYKPVGGPKGDFLSVLSTSNKNLLLEFRNSSEIEKGKLKAGPKRIILLRDSINDTDEFFVRIVDGPGSSSDHDQVREIVVHQDKFAVLDSDLAEVPTTDTEYDIFKVLEHDKVVEDAGDNDVKLISGTVATGDHFVFVIGKTGGEPRQFRRITNVTTSTSGATATVGRWDENPQKDDEYFILERLHAGRHAVDGSDRCVVLDGVSTLPASGYANLFLEITQPGQFVFSDNIAQFLVDIRGVVFNNDLPIPPDANATYRITAGQFADRWQSYRDPNQTELRPELSWEYWNGKGFVHLPVDDSTDKFLVPGKVTFIIPEDIDKTEVAGQENYWIRARIVGGDYGREQFTFNQKTGELKVEKDPIRPPRILKIGISYNVTEYKEPQFCLTFNSLTYLDQTAANVTPNKNFFPFVPLSDEGKTLYFGFDRAFKGGPVKIYFAAKELEVDETNKPKLLWQFAFENDWKELLAEDATEGFTRPDFVTLNVTDDIQNRQQFGKTLYWLRTTLTEGEWNGSPLFSGVFLNAVEAIQARTVLDEILGSSTGEKDQIFRFQQTPVIEGEEVRVLEALTDEEREQLLLTEGEDTVRTITDQQGRVLATWIRWTEVLEFFDSDTNSRNYRLDRHTGEIEFGDGIHGRIPPAGGDNIVAFRYQAGGGAAGNVKPGDINTAVTAVAGVDSVINPVAAGGGSDAATNEEMLTIGPAQISHRERAVTPDDFERLALEASREVRKARCLPNRNASGRQEVGWTTLHIVPDSEEREPVPSLGLRRAVLRYLSDRADVTLVDQEHIVIGPPKYVPVTVEATVYAKSLDLVANAERKVKTGLETFLHPLKGGPENQGWEFGRDLAASDLYALLEDIDEVDYVGSLKLFSGNSPSGEQVEVDPDALIASGTHKITTTVAPENK
jgi:hypothetical protein